MKTESDNITYSECLDEIRQELTEAELSEISDEEYIALLSRHISNLVSFVEELSSQSSFHESFSKIINTLFADLTEPVCILDTKYKVVFFNQAWKRYLKLSVLGAAISDLFSKDQKIAVADGLKKAGRTGKRCVFTVQTGNTTKLISALPFNGIDDNTHFLIMVYNEEVIRNIQTNENTIGNTKKSIETFEMESTFLEMIDGFYFTLNKRLNIQTIGGRYCEKLGANKADLLRKPFINLLDKPSAQLFNDEVAKLYLGDGINEKRIDVSTTETKKRKKHFSLTLRKDTDSEKLFGLCNDITKYRQKELDLELSKRNAELNDKLKSDFLANMSHEIRTPLNGIVGFSTMLGQENINPDKRDKYRRIIRSSTMHLLNLVSDIIDISKIEAGQLQMVYTPVNVHHLLEELLVTFTSEAERLGKREIKIVKQTERPKADLYIKNDDTRLRQVFTNLLSNAVKFTEKGQISFGYRIEQENSITFFVKDTGAGMTQTAQKTVFARYKQTQEGQKNKYKGSGIGLAITKGIVKLMNGVIEVKSEPGEGSEFYFTIPVDVSSET